MAKDTSANSELVGQGAPQHTNELPLPSMQFRWRAWLAFQRALDPLAQPRALPIKPRR
jgi:hypothetical protein